MIIMNLAYYGMTLWIDNALIDINICTLFTIYESLLVYAYHILHRISMEY